MNAVTAVILSVLAIPGLATVSGRVLDEQGQPIAGARVFLEAGLFADVEEGTITADGTFAFNDIPPGLIGVFAYADGNAFGGGSINVTATDEPRPLEIRLRSAGTLSGVCEDLKGKPVEGAMITRVGIVGDKIGIPLAKLTALGFKLPTSDASGRFTVSYLPSGALVDLKVGHVRYAQEAVKDVSAGKNDIKVTLSDGVLLSGEVFARTENATVANADVVFRNAQTSDTALSRSDSRGAFALKLKPGHYVFQATSAKHQSPAWERLTITGEQPTVNLRVNVLGLGTITGVAKDVRTQAPVEGAKFVLQAGGSTAQIVRTGPSGKFEISAAEGENILTLDSAPGYLPPEKLAVRVNVVEGKSIELPVFWLASIPTYGVEVVDESMAPVQGAIVTMYQPAQFGWYVTDAKGKVQLSFASLPPGSRVIGFAEHPNQPKGALFAFDAAAEEFARVQLLPLATVKGQVLGKGKRPVQGAVVGAFYADEGTPQPVLLWKTLTRDEGYFQWPSVAPQVPFKCVVTLGGESVAGESAATILQEGTNRDLGVIDATHWTRGSSATGNTFDWHKNRPLGGPEGVAGKPTLVMCCPPNEATAVIEALTKAKPLLAQWGVQAAIVVNGEVKCDGSAVTVVQGKAPSAASVYLLNPNDEIVLETYSMPPLAAIQQIAAR